MILEMYLLKLNFDNNKLGKEFLDILIISKF